ncbi:hypothetical protein EfmAA290_18360 [Enterococcus faecium]|nr:hypothetical protein EfmAA290_18360 [Enterococcus faecium]
MTQVHFTLKSEEIQSIIEYSVKDDVSKNILTTKKYPVALICLILFLCYHCLLL